MNTRNILAIVSVVFGCASIQAQAGQGACLPADDKAENLRSTLVAIASSDDPEDRALRDSLRVPVTTADSVLQVLDHATCQSIIAAADLAMGAAQPRGQAAYVFRVGTAFAIYDPLTDPIGSYVVFIDSAFQLLGVTST